MTTLTKPSISFEFFPPKTIEGVNHLAEAAMHLMKFHPEFFSVTFGAGGSTRDGTIETVRMLQQKTSLNIAPHLACIGSQREEMLTILQEYKKMGISRIIALRGDLPSGMGQAGEFQYASDLVVLIRETMGNLFRIEVAAYPEFHPQAASAHDDVLNLKRKFEAGANGAITQYFFNSDAYYYYLDDCARLNINMPIIPGVMPISQFSKLARFSDMCGAEIPFWIRKRLQSYGDDIDSIQKFGIEVIYNLCQDLLKNGAPGLHFYTLNKAELSIQILNGLVPIAPALVSSVASHVF